MFLIGNSLKEKDFDTIRWILFISLFLICIYGIYQHFWGLEETRKFVAEKPYLMNSFSPTFFARLQSNRVFANFVEPNTYAAYLLLIYPVIIFTIFDKNKLLKYCAVCLVPFLIYNLFLTGSIGGIFCLVVITFLMLLYFLISKKTFIIASIVLAVVSLLFLAVGAKMHFLLHMRSFSDRIKYWQTGINIFKIYPLTGVGLNNFQLFYPTYKISEAMDVKYAHNIIIELLADTGIIGIAAFLLFSVIFIFFSIKTLLKSYNLFIVSLIFSIVAIFSNWLGEFNYANMAIAGMCFVFLGILSSTNNLSNVFLSSKLTKSILGVMIIGVIFAMIYQIRIWESETYINRIVSEKINPKNFFTDVKKAENLYPRAEISFIKGRILWNLFEINKTKIFAIQAINAYKKASLQNPYSVQYHRDLAFSYYQTGKVNEAEKEFKKVIDLYPTNPQYYWEMGIFYKNIGMPKKAIPYIKKANQLPRITLGEDKIIGIYQKEYGKNF
jgi:tetratricopeptide (TPR) repeat protein